MYTGDPRAAPRAISRWCDVVIICRVVALSASGATVSTLPHHWLQLVEPVHTVQTQVRVAVSVHVTVCVESARACCCHVATDQSMTPPGRQESRSALLALI